MAVNIHSVHPEQAELLLGAAVASMGWQSRFLKRGGGGDVGGDAPHCALSRCASINAEHVACSQCCRVHWSYKGRKQIRKIRRCGAPFGVKRVHGVAGEGSGAQGWVPYRDIEGTLSQTKPLVTTVRCPAFAVPIV